MAFIGSLTTTGSSVSTIVNEARWKAANHGGTNPGSVSLVLETGDYGNISHENATGSIIFVTKNGGATNTAGRIVSNGNAAQDLVLSSSTSHGDIRFTVNDNGSNFNLMTITAGRLAGGLAGYRAPKVFITDTAQGYDKGVEVPFRGQGLLTVSTQTDQIGLQIIHTGTATEAALEIKKKHSGANTTTSLFTVRPGETVVNDSQADYDFRVESDNQANMFYVDGGNDRVAIANDAPMAALDINAGGQNTLGLVLRTNDSSGVASEYKGLMMQGSAIMTVTGSTSGKTRFIGTNDANPDGEIELIGKTKSDSVPGDSLLWFTTLAGDASTYTKNMYIGYDASDSQVIIGESNTFGNNRRLSVGNGDVVFNEDSADVNFRIESNTDTHAFFMDGTNGRISIGDDTSETRSSQTSAYVSLSKTDTDLWDSDDGSSNDVNSMHLMLRNNSNIERTFTGIAFDPCTEVDADSIGAAIIAERDGVAHGASTLHHTNLIFCTNHTSDDDLSERLRIAYDGQLYTGRLDNPGVINIIRHDSAINSGDEIGVLSFKGREDYTGMHHAIVSGTLYEAANIKAITEANMTAGDSPSCLTFSTTPDGAAAATEKVRISALGLVGIGMTPSAGTLDITHSNIGAANYGVKITSAAGSYSSNMMWLANPDASGESMPGWGVFHGDTGELTFGAAENSTHFKLDDAGYAHFTGGTIKIGSTTVQGVGASLNLKADGGLNLYINDDGGNGSEEFRWYDNATERMVLDRSGNLQIDGDLTVSGGDIASAAGSTLRLKSDANMQFYIDDDGDGDNNFIWYDDATIRMRLGANGDLSLNGQMAIGGVDDLTTDCDLAIYQSVNSNSGGIRLRGSGGLHFWNMRLSDDSNRLYFKYDSTAFGGYLATAADVGQITFTGQHRTAPSVGTVDDFNDKAGLIVVSTGAYYNLTSTSHMGIPTINEALPKVALSTVPNQKSAFGVISNIEDTNKPREFSSGGWVTTMDKSEGDERLIVNSLGEGAMWITNINGDLENGDYITTSAIAGYGMKQDDDLLHNYTVAKITQACDFDLTSETYACEEITHNDVVYRKAFIGCTYHCG